MNVLGEQLSRLRKENNRSHEDLAVTLYVTCQEVALWEVGQVRPTIHDLRKLSKMYGVSLESIIGHKKLKRKTMSVVLKKCVGARGILYLKNVKNQPFFPACVVKNIEILEVKATSMKIRTYDKAATRQIVYIKNVLGFLEEVNY